jgi:mono/diheme cytochrome c family protein
MAATAVVVACVGLVAVGRVQAQPKVDAAALYKTHCQLCHGANGTSPMKNASFTDGQWLRGSSLAEVQASIKNGVKGTVMMGFGAKLSAAEIEALARHVRAFDKSLK